MKHTGILTKAEMFKIEDMLFVYGIVVEHLSPQWQKGDWLCTSLIEDINADALTVRTQNSLYKIDRLISPIEISVQQWGLVRQGMPPSIVKASEADKANPQ